MVSGSGYVILLLFVCQFSICLRRQHDFQFLGCSAFAFSRYHERLVVRKQFHCHGLRAGVRGIFVVTPFLRDFRFRNSGVLDFTFQIFQRIIRCQFNPSGCHFFGVFAGYALAVQAGQNASAHRCCAVPDDFMLCSHLKLEFNRLAERVAFRFCRCLGLGKDIITIVKTFRAELVTIFNLQFNRYTLF